MFRMRSVWAVVVVAASVLLLVPVIWAEEKEVSSATEFEVVIPKVTIDVKDTPVSQVLAELNRQAGVELKADQEVGGQTVTLDVKDVPVLQALAKLLKLTGAVIYWRPEEGLLLVPSFPEGRPELLAVAGPCLLTQYGTPWLSADHFFLSDEGYVVSRPVPALVSEPVVTEVLDAEGKPVAQEEPFVMGPSGIVNAVEETRGGISRFSLTAGLEGLASAPPFPRTIRGTISLTFASEMAEITFDLDADIGQMKKVGEVEITYLRRQTTGSGAGGPSYRFAVAGKSSRVRQFTLKDAVGRTVRIGERTRVYKGRLTEVELQPEGQAKTVTCQVVLKAVTRTYPFEFKDTPAPEEE